MIHNPRDQRCAEVRLLVYPLTLFVARCRRFQYSFSHTRHAAHDTFASHLKTAHTALFDLLKRCSGDSTHTSYAEAGISLQIVSGVAARATAKPFCGANGQFVLGLELTVPDVRTASYLLLDAITAVENGELDEVINNNKSMCAHIDEIDGYPTIFEWLYE